MTTLTVDRRELADVLAIAVRVIPKRVPLPVLEGVLIVVDGDGQGVSVTAVGLRDGDQTRYTGRVTGNGTPGQAFVVPARVLNDFVKVRKGEAVVIEREQGKPSAHPLRVRVSCAGATISLVDYTDDEYPLPVARGALLLSARVGTVKLARGLTLVEHAAYTSSDRPILSVVRAHFNGKLELAAANGYALAVTQLDYTGDTGELLIHVATVDMLQRALKDTIKRAGKAGHAGVVAIAAYGIAELAPGRVDRATVAELTTGRHTITTVLIDGTYPDFNQVIPVNRAREVVVVLPVAPWLEFVASARKTDTYRLDLSMGAGSVTIDAYAKLDDSEVFAALPVVGVVEGVESGTRYKYALQPALLHSALQAAHAATIEYVRCQFALPSQPVLITGQHEDVGALWYKSWRYVQMPMHLKD